MSLLIPTTTDYSDAHRDSEQVDLYNKEIEKIKDTLNWEFQVVPGFFKQSDSTTDDLRFNYATDNLGRLMSWKDLTSKLIELNKNSAPNESYKLIYFARHGQGYHNLCVEKYGFSEWNNKWHSMTTDGEIVWAPDPKLTCLGEQQAAENNMIWKEEFELGAPYPSKFYVSPLQRAMRTCYITWKGIKNPIDKVKVVESLREAIGVTLCDKRSSKKELDGLFDGFNFDTSNLSNQDELFKDSRETLCEHSIRVNHFLQELFEEDCIDGILSNQLKHRNTIISTTSHAGTIRAAITVLGHRNFTISTGGMIPIVVKATRKANV